VRTVRLQQTAVKRELTKVQSISGMTITLGVDDNLAGVQVITPTIIEYNSC